MEESESAVKQVLSTLWSYLYSSLPPNEDFIIQLEIDGILARNDATKLRASARLGGRACIQDLIIFMYDFFDEPALEKFCTFLDKYGQPTRPLMLEVAAKIREEMGLKLQPVHELTPEDPQKGTSRPRADVGDGTSSADLNQHVYLPVIDDLKTSFSTLAGNVLDIIDSLSDRNLKTFSTNFLLNYLKPSFPPDAPLPVIPETVEDLKLFLICRWDSLQIALLKTVVEHLGSRKIEDATFKASVQQVKADLIAYEDLLKGKLPEFLSKCRSESVSLKPLLGHSSVSVKIASNPEEISLARIIKLKRFFINQLGLSDTVFIGFSEGCIVLFFSIPTECVWSLPSCLLPSNLSLLEEWKVLFLSVKGAFTVDIKERRVIDSLDKHSLLSSLAEDKTLIEDLRTKVQQLQKEKYLHFKKEELRAVMETEVKVSRKWKDKAAITDQEIEEKVSFEEKPVVKTELPPYLDIKAETSPDVSLEPSSKRFKTVPDSLAYEPPLEKKSEEKVPRVVVQRGRRGEDGPSSSQSTTSELTDTVISDADAASHLGIAHAMAALDLTEGTSQPIVHTDAWLAKDPPHRKLETAFFRLQSHLAKIFNMHIDDVKPFLRICQKHEEWPFTELEVEDINSTNDVQTIFKKMRIENCWLNTEILIRLINILPDKKSRDKAKRHLEVYHKLLGVFSKCVLLSHIPKDDARLEHFHSRMFPKLRVTYDVNMEDFDVSKLLEQQKFLSKIFQIPEEAFHYLGAKPTL